LDAGMPVVALVSPQPLGNQGAWRDTPALCGRTLVAAGANVIGVNCCPPWEAEAFIRQLADLEEVRRGSVLLSAMPNAGGLQRIDNRYMSSVNPEFMGRQARTFADLGVRLIGGCCEVHPPHIREMAGYLRSRQAGTAAAAGRVTAPHAAAWPPAGPAQKLANGRFSRKLFSNQFAVSVELLPPRGTDPKVLAAKVAFVRELAASGLADAVDLTDGSRGIPLMPPGDFTLAARRLLGWPGTGDDPLEFIPHFAARDLNTMGIQSRLTGYHFNAVHNVIYITGDPPKMSPTYPRSTAVFDLDSPAMIHYTHACLNAGLDFGGQPLGKQPDPRMHFTIGTGFEPEALNLQHELAKLERKVTNGADYVLTQPAFRTEPLAVLEPYRDRVRILIGVMILTGLAHAQRVADVPGVTIPREIFDRLERFAQPDDQAKVGREIAAEQIAWARRTGWAGLYLMSPASHKPILEVLAAQA
jgi:homocysteine S-methyltransferase